ncbi:unnamed protein product [Linum tenue]|uniref:F-box domain-containing protein n=1 Tax=Linum tenue TaxID=586396 RepID=A0AAV0QGS0_9ROSI|nr:unnamed protein product [Linum tenue]
MATRMQIVADEISRLPDNIREQILMYLPLREAAKASILSSSWRNMWTRLPKLVFNKSFCQTNVEAKGQDQIAEMSKLMLKLCTVLLLHRGPLQELSLSLPILRSFPDRIDQVLMFLQEKCSINSLTITVGSQYLKRGLPTMNNYEVYKLPSRLFSFSQLKILHLSCCQLTSSRFSFECFNVLTVLKLRNVIFKHSYSTWSIRCPLLSALTLVDCGRLSEEPHIVIEAPQLGRFHFEGKFSSLQLNNTPFLKTAYLHKWNPSPVDLKVDPSKLLQLWGGLAAVELLSVSGYLYQYLRLRRGNNQAIDPCPLRMMQKISDTSSAVMRRDYGGALDVGKLRTMLQDGNGPLNCELGGLKSVEVRRLNGTSHETAFVGWLVNSSPSLDSMEIQLALEWSAQRKCTQKRCFEEEGQYAKVVSCKVFEEPDFVIEATKLGRFELDGKFSSLHLKDTPVLRTAILRKQFFSDGDEKEEEDPSKLWDGLAAVESLYASGDLYRYLAGGNKETISLGRQLEMLTQLTLDGVCLSRRSDVWSALCLITKSPNLRRLSISMELNRRLIHDSIKSAQLGRLLNGEPKESSDSVFKNVPAVGQLHLHNFLYLLPADRHGSPEERASVDRISRLPTKPRHPPSGHGENFLKNRLSFAAISPFVISTKKFELAPRSAFKRFHLATVKASLLSTKWRNMWANIPCLVFDRSFCPMVRVCQHQDAAIGKLMLNLCTVLFLHRGPLREFSLSLPLLRSFPDHIERILVFLQEKQIDCLTITLEIQYRFPCFPSYKIECYQLPRRVFSSFSRLKTLRLCCCEIKTSPVSFDGFRMLTVLELRNVIFSDGYSSTPWSFRCPLLSALTLDDCGGLFEEPDIVIEAPKLSNFRFFGKFSSLHLKHTPLLKTAVLNKQFPPTEHKKDGPSKVLQIWGGLAAVESLSVSGHFYQMKKNLKQMSDTSTSAAMGTVPSGELDDGRFRGMIVRAFGYRMAQLKRVEVKRVNGAKPEMTYIRWLLNSSPALAKMEIQLSPELSAAEKMLILTALNGFERISAKARITIT